MLSITFLGKKTLIAMIREGVIIFLTLFIFFHLIELLRPSTVSFIFDYYTPATIGLMGALLLCVIHKTDRLPQLKTHFVFRYLIESILTCCVFGITYYLLPTQDFIIKLTISLLIGLTILILLLRAKDAYE